MKRRSALLMLCASAFTPKPAFAATPREITWDDLIPKGLPYPQIIGEGELDEANDFWNPIYDENSTKLVEDLNGAYIRMPGFVVPFEMASDGVRDFMLVPYAGACIHTPPPPANQLVVAKTETPWPDDQLWDPVWAEGTLHTQLQDTELGQTGYAMSVDKMEIYEW